LPYTFAGIWEIHPQWLEEHLQSVQIVDVRERDEYDGPLGRIPEAKLISLGELAARAKEIGNERPIVTVCRAGGRSAQATVILRQAGFEDVANLAGGMLRWRAEGRVVENGSV
jgi:rhodanese-related sulfurtransferase